MKNILIIVILFLTGSCQPAKGQTYFQIDKIEKDLEKVDSMYKHIYEKNGWGIELKTGSPFPFGYPSKKTLTRGKTDKEILNMIEELLTYKGDSRKCFKKVSCYNINISSLYSGSRRTYTIELEALFLINQIFFDKPFHYSPYPVLRKNGCKWFNNNDALIKAFKEDRSNTISRKKDIERCDYDALIKEAFQEYEEWFKEVKRVGLKEAQEKEIYPFSNSNLSWY